MIFMNRALRMLKGQETPLKKYREQQKRYQKRWVTLRGRDWKDSEKATQLAEYLIHIDF
jgi:hypothetical protein